MLHQKVNAESYRREFSTKFENFLNKAPILASFVLSGKGVDVVHENTQLTYHYDWNYTNHLKSFIHGIKMDLVKHYPRIIKTEVEEIKLSPEEQAQLIENSDFNAQTVPMTKTHETHTQFRIDKVIIHKDTFIIINEKTEEAFKYRMRKPCAYFLVDYRKGKYKTLEHAGEVFFTNSDYMGKIGDKEAVGD